MKLAVFNKLRKEEEEKVKKRNAGQGFTLKNISPQ